jgi:hypothetical protein
LVIYSKWLGRTLEVTQTLNKFPIPDNDVDLFFEALLFKKLAHVSHFFIGGHHVVMVDPILISDFQIYNFPALNPQFFVKKRVA